MPLSPPWGFRGLPQRNEEKNVIDLTITQCG